DPADGNMLGFAAGPSIDVAGIYAAAQAANSTVLNSYPTSPSSKNIANIYSDWQNLTGVSTFYFIADMDTDCDGPSGNTDGQKLTSFGTLDAKQVPYFVLPLKFTKDNKSILKDNVLGAIICSGKMFYGIYGDQEIHKVIGEASILMGQSCFPQMRIDGANSHAAVDIACEHFTISPGTTTDHSIDIPALKNLGDAQVKLLQTTL
ncbi:fungal chitosanase of glycosyl hydrolase group 75-domain-containing protein, partial [Mycena sp. CBHHK59/15]